jgi:polyketide cyclase/dehydrase/lipid transport protein
MIRFLLRFAIVSAVIGWVVDRHLASRAGGRPPQAILATMVVHAPIETVWDVLTDIDGQTRWMDDMKAVRILTAPPTGVGTRAEGDIRIFGIGVLDPITVTAFDRPTRFAIRHEGAFSGEGLIQLESSAGVPGDPTTTARWTETIVPPLLPHLGALVLAPILRWVFERDLENLRKLIETAPERA